jgi:hypothetical protein
MKRFNQSIEELKPEWATAFVMDCLLLNDVAFPKHAQCLKSGIGWFEPNQTGTAGRVSTPFPILVNLMERCNDEKFSSIAVALNPAATGFSPTKAMEYVSELAVLLHRTKSIDSWQNLPSRDGFEIVEQASRNFFTVWKLPNHAVIDFGAQWLEDPWSK